MNADPIFNEHPLLAACGICRIGHEHGEYGAKICTFSVGLRDGQKAWMKLSLGHDSDKWVVIVRKRPFLEAWAQNGREPQLANGDETVWRKDFKFHRSEKCFSPGYADPVPLALCEARYELDKGLPVLNTSFTDGITRTIWLLANGAESLPVSVTSEISARLLFRGAGDRKTEPLSVAFLHSLCA